MKNSKITQNNILKAAEIIFAEKGYHGASINEIAAAAKVNKRMIYVYFGNKEDLYVAVLKIVFDRLTEISKTIDLTLSPEQLIERFIYSYFKFLSENENFVRLFMWENLNNAKYISSSVDEIKKDSDLLLKHILNQGIKNGAFKDNIYINEVVSAVSKFICSYVTNVLICGNSINSKSDLQKKSKFISEMILSYLKR